jgi:WD repeat and SOF domain-containing protein 1
MKVKVISRNPNEYIRETKHDIHKSKSFCLGAACPGGYGNVSFLSFPILTCLWTIVARNYDPKLHPFESAREYQRAVNAVKLDNIFARPFIGSLEGHSDVVQCMMKHPTSLSTLVSASADGEIRIWNIATRKCIRSFRAHDGVVRALCAPRSGEYFFSLDGNANIKQWKLNPFSSSIASSGQEDEDADDSGDLLEPVNTMIGSSLTMAMDHHYSKPLLLTGGETVQLWEESRSEPLKSFSWGCDSIYSVRFNPVETDVCCSTAGDRSIILYDIRKSSPLRKVVLEMRSNTIAWNPMDAFTFTAANEDFE